MRLIKINEESCTKCGKCARVCPSGVIVQEKVGERVALDYFESCITCGHCVAVCATDSIDHSEFPQGTLHTIDRSLLPTPEQMMMLIKSRRSNRSMTSQSISQEALELIVEAARYAPTATNRRNITFTIINDADALLKVSDITINTFTSLARRLTNPLIKLLVKPFIPDVYRFIPALHRLKKEHEQGRDPILRRATALIIFHAPKTSKFGCEDSNLAYQNASLMAETLGISQVYMGFVMQAMKHGGKEQLSQILGDNGKIYAIMALGIPAFKYTKYPTR